MASASSDLEDTVRIPTATGLPNLRLAALFTAPVLRSCFRSPRLMPVYGILTTAEGLSLCGRYFHALLLCEKARRMVKDRGDFAEALACMALGRINAISDLWDYAVAEQELRRAKEIFERLPWSPINELLLLWTTVILADLLTERDPDVIDENAKDLAREAKVLLENCIPFGQDSCDSSSSTTSRRRWFYKIAPFWGRTKKRIHRKLAWFHFYMWAAVSTTAIFFHTNCADEGLDLTRRLLDVAHRREGRSWLTIELQFAVGVFLSSKRDYVSALDAYRTARDWHTQKRLVSGPPTEDDEATSDPLMNYYIAICLSRLGHDAEAADELAKINLVHAVVHDECEFHDDDFDNDLLGLVRKTYFSLGRDEQVVSLCETFSVVLDAKMGRYDLATMANMEDHATALRNLGRLDEVAVVLRDMLAREDATPAWSRARRVGTAMQLCDVLRELGCLEEAAYHYRKTLEVLRRRRRRRRRRDNNTTNGDDNSNEDNSNNVDDDDDDGDDDDNEGDNDNVESNTDNNDADDGIISQDDSSDTWPQRRFALVQLIRLYDALGRPAEAQTALAHLQSGLRAAPPTPDTVMRYFWYRGRMFAAREKYKLAADMFARARDAREELVVAEAAAQRRAAEREHDELVARFADLEKIMASTPPPNTFNSRPWSPSWLLPPPPPPPPPIPTSPSPDACLAAIESGLIAAKQSLPPPTDPFERDDTTWPRERIVRPPPLFREDDVWINDAPPHHPSIPYIRSGGESVYAHDPRIEPSLREECAVGQFGRVPPVFEGKRGGAWAGMSRTMQVYG